MKLSRVFLYRSAIIGLLAALALGAGLLPGGSADAGVTEKIAFTSDRDGNQEIYVMNADGSEQTRLTNNAADDYGPAWSPDGTKIAFTSNRDGNQEIYVMNADGSNQVRITNVPGESASGPAWSHDGSRIAFAAIREGVPSISTMNPDGSGVTRVTDNPPGSFLEGDLNPDWSPDDLQLVFWGLPRSRMGFTAIFKINVDGTGIIRLFLLESGLSEGEPTWSPDGSQIAFQSNRHDLGNFRHSVYVSADGGGQTRLTNSQADDRGPAWSPDGGKIVFSSNRDDPNPDTCRPSCNYEIYVMNPDGTGQTRLTDNSADDHSPAWPPLKFQPPPTPIGDVGCDGTVGSLDALLLLQFIAGLLDALPCEQNADVNLDGNIDSLDAILILQFVAGLISNLPP